MENVHNNNNDNNNVIVLIDDIKIATKTKCL